MKPALRSGNRIDLLCNGEEYFPALIAAIQAAQREIHLETYIFASDVTGIKVAIALSEAAQRGVAVRVLVDGFGARAFIYGLGAELAAAGVEVLAFRPELGGWRLQKSRLRRMHRKLAVIDARIGFIGGINVIDDADTPGHTPPRFDYALRISGPLLADLHRAVRRLWQLVRWVELRQRPPQPQSVAAVVSRSGTVKAALVIRDNLGHRRDIEECYLEAINAAQHDVLIANAYFMPGWRFRRALMEAARRGVRVRLLLQGRMEYLLLHYATRALYGALLFAGVEIFEYQRGFLHAKVAVIDADWATVGSSNIDPFSLLLAREANVLVVNGSFAAKLRLSLEAALSQHARALSSDKAVSIIARIGQWLAYGVVRALIALGGGQGSEDYR